MVRRECRVFGGWNRNSPSPRCSVVRDLEDPLWSRSMLIQRRASASPRRRPRSTASTYSACSRSDSANRNRVRTEPATDLVASSLHVDELRDVAHYQFVSHRALQGVAQYGVRLLDHARAHARLLQLTGQVRRSGADNVRIRLRPRIGTR